MPTREVSTSIKYLVDVAERGLKPTITAVRDLGISTTKTSEQVNLSSKAISAAYNTLAKTAVTADVTVARAAVDSASTVKTALDGTIAKMREQGASYQAIIQHQSELKVSSATLAAAIKRDSATQIAAMQAQRAEADRLAAANKARGDAVTAQYAAAQRVQAATLGPTAAAIAGPSMLSRAGTSIRGAGGRISAAGHSMSGLSVPLLGAAVVSIKQAVDFQSAMALIQTQAGASAAEVKNLSAAVLKLAPQVGSGPAELAKALFSIESVGVRGAKAMDLLHVAAEGAHVGHADLAQTTDVLVGALKTADLHTHGLGATMGVLNAIVGGGKLHMPDLTAALTTGILPAAKGAGLGLTDVGAAIDVMTARSVPAIDAASRLKMVIASLQTGSKGASDALKAIGLSHDKLATAMRGPGGLAAAVALLDKSLTTSGLSKNQQAGLLATVVGRRSLAPALMLLQHSAELTARTATLSTAGTGPGFAQAVVAEQATAAHHLEVLKATLQATSVQLGTQLLPVATSVAGVISQLFTAFSDLPGPVRKVIGVVAITLGVLGPLSILIGGVAKAVGALTSGLGWLAAKLGLTTAATRRATVATEAQGVAAATGGRVGGAAGRLGALAKGAGAAGLVILAADKIAPADKSVMGLPGGRTSSVQTSIHDMANELKASVASLFSGDLGGAGRGLLQLAGFAHAPISDVRKLGEEIKGLGGNLTSLNPTQLAKIHDEASKFAHDPAYAKWRQQLLGVANAFTPLGVATTKVGAQFADMASYAGKRLADILLASKVNMVQIETTFGTKSRESRAAVAQNFALAAQDIQASMNAGVVSVQGGTTQILKLLADALRAISGANAPSAAVLQQIGVASAQQYLANVQSNNLAPSLNRPGAHRGGGLVGYAGGGLVPAMFSPGEQLVYGNSTATVPGARVAADSVFGMVPAGTAVLTDHGQALMGGGASLGDAIAMQLPHFSGGGVTSFTDPTGKGRGHGGGRGRSHAAKGLAEHWKTVVGSVYDDAGATSSGKHYPHGFAELSPPGTSSAQVNFNTANVLGRLPYGTSVLVRKGPGSPVFSAQKDDIGRGSGAPPWAQFDMGNALARALGVSTTSFKGPVQIGTMQAGLSLGSLGLGKAAKGAAPPTLSSAVAALTGPGAFGAGYQAGLGGMTLADTARSGVLQTLMGDVAITQSGLVGGSQPLTSGTGGGPGGSFGGSLGAMISTATSIANKRYNYEWGGGHNPSFAPTSGSGHGSGPGIGYDCSGAVSAVLHAGGVLRSPLASGGLMGWGQKGRGKQVSVFSSPTHTFMQLAGRYFGTSMSNPGGGAGWIPRFPENMPATTHPPGLRRGGFLGFRAGGPAPSVSSSRPQPTTGSARFGRAPASSSTAYGTVGRLVNQADGANVDALIGLLASETTNLALGNLMALVAKLQHHSRRGLDAIQNRRLDTAINTVTAQIGDRIGLAVLAAQDAVDKIGRDKAHVSNYLTGAGIDPSSTAGLALVTASDKATAQGFNAQIGVLNSALATAKKYGDKATIRDLTDKLNVALGNLDSATAQVLVDWRAGIERAAQDAVDASTQGVGLAQGGLDTLKLKQQLAGTDQTPGAGQAQGDYITSTLIPALQAQLAATQKDQAAAQSVGDMIRVLADQLTATQEGNGILQAQLDAQTAIKGNTASAANALKAQGGQLAFQFQGETFTDRLVSMGVGT